MSMQRRQFPLCCLGPGRGDLARDASPMGARDTSHPKRTLLGDRRQCDQVVAGGSSLHQFRLAFDKGLLHEAIGIFTFLFSFFMICRPMDCCNVLRLSSDRTTRKQKKNSKAKLNRSLMPRYGQTRFFHAS